MQLKQGCPTRSLLSVGMRPASIFINCMYCKNKTIIWAVRCIIRAIHEQEDNHSHGRLAKEKRLDALGLNCREQNNSDTEV